MVAAVTFRGASCSGISSRVCLWVVLFWQLSLALAEASLLSSSSGVSTQVTSIASGDDQPLDVGAYALPRRDQVEGSALEDNVEGGDQKAAGAQDTVKEQMELAELIGEYALDKKAKIVAEMTKASRKAAFGMVWFLVCVALFEVLYRAYVKPAALELQKAYGRMHPGREPRPLTLVEILLASPLASAINTAIMFAMTMVVINICTNLYRANVRTMDLNTLLEEEKLEEQEKAAKEKAAKEKAAKEEAAESVSTAE